MRERERGMREREGNERERVRERERKIDVPKLYAYNECEHSVKWMEDPKSLAYLGLLKIL